MNHDTQEVEVPLKKKCGKMTVDHKVAFTMNENKETITTIMIKKGHHINDLQDKDQVLLESLDKILSDTNKDVDLTNVVVEVAMIVQEKILAEVIVNIGVTQEETNHNNHMSIRAEVVVISKDNQEVKKDTAVEAVKNVENYLILNYK